MLLSRRLRPLLLALHNLVLSVCRDVKALSTILGASEL